MHKTNAKMHCYTRHMHACTGLESVHTCVTSTATLIVHILFCRLNVVN